MDTVIRETLTQFLGASWGVLLELAPWLLLGAAIAGILHAALPAGWVARELGGRLGVLKAVVLGVPLPLCSCGVIPAGLGLSRQGASPGATVGFLVSTPQTGVDSVLVSASFLGWPFAVFKLGSALVLGLVGGYATDALTADAPRPSPSPTAAPVAELDVLPADASITTRVQAGWSHAVMLVQTLWGWLVFGILASAALTTFVPAEAFVGLAAYGTAVTLGTVLAISLPLYVCATASVPIAAALVAQGFPPGAALVFLMAGPATNVATIGAVHRAFGPRILAVYLFTLVGGSVGAGLFFDSVVVADTTATMVGHDHGATAGAPWWMVGSAVLLLGAFVWFAIEDAVETWRAFRRSATPAQAIEISVDGMTCQGCARKVRHAVGAVPGVEDVEITLDPGLVRIQGTVDPERLRLAVRNAGFAPRTS